MSITTICLILFASFISYESEKVKPKPYPLGSGDTLMVRTIGYGFCPQYCEADHFHVGHFKNYDCEEYTCNHITINDEWFSKTCIFSMDGKRAVFCLQYVGKLEFYCWYHACIYDDGNGKHQTLIG